MKVTESFYVGEELGREARTLPAGIYNQLRLLHRQSGRGDLFISIRSMQYLAVFDGAEAIFVDGLGSRVVELAWRRFQPQARAALNEPVPYELVLYRPQGQEIQRRLTAELPAALRLLASRVGSAVGGEVLGFPGRKDGT
jgi:hypothetical protein